jgi:hypothetical protein
MSPKTGAPKPAVPKTSAMTTLADAEQKIEALTGVIGKLHEVIEQETALVQQGQVRNAAALGAAKAELAGQLFECGEWMKANAALLLQSAPANCSALKRVDKAFRAVLQRNMVVLATSHAVSEGIVRRLSGDLARKRAPQIYSASGRTVPDAKHGQPLAISRLL